MFGRSGKRPEMLRTSQGKHMDLEQKDWWQRRRYTWESCPISITEYLCEMLITDNFPRQLHSQLTTSLPFFGDTCACVAPNPGLISSALCSFCWRLSLSTVVTVSMRAIIHFFGTRDRCTNARVGSSFGTNEKCQPPSSDVRPPSVHRSWLTLVAEHL